MCMLVALDPRRLVRGVRTLHMPGMRVDRNHVHARALLKQYPQPCWRCGAQATTVGHNPPRALHEHIPNTECCVLLPECAQCNYGEGTRIARIKQRARTNPNPSREW